MMDLRSIKTFQTIARLGSFQKAADELMYVQSTVTMQIQKLEADLGVKLIERGRKIYLTEAGRVFNETADVLLKDVEFVQQSMDQWMHGETGKVRIGAIEPMALYRMPKILAQYSAQYPKVQITIQVNNTQNLTRLLKDGEIDFALCNTPELDHTLSFEPLLTENVSLLLPETHPLQQNEKIFLTDFQNERLLLGAFVCNYRIHLEKSLMEAGVHPQIGLVVNSMTAIKEYVQAGLGIAVIPDVIIGTPPIGLVKRKIEDLKVGVVTGILKKANGIKNGTAVKRLITALKESTN